MIWQVRLGLMTHNGSPPDKTCTCLLMIHQGAAPVSDFASD